MAGRLIGNAMARRIDADDVVQAALSSFFVKARRGRYSISRSGQLWSLLAKITTSKARKLAEEHTAQCRNVYHESPGGVPASAGGDSNDPVISAILRDEIDAALRSVSQREADVFRLSRGEFRPIEDYLSESLQTFSDAILVDLLRKECVNRQEFGCKADVVELRRRFPHLEGHDGFSVFSACEPPATDSGNSERLDGRTEFRDPVPQSGDLRYVNGKKFGKFVLRKVLGYGAMGVVFRAYDSILGRDVALKIPVAAPTFAGMIDEQRVP